MALIQALGGKVASRGIQDAETADDNHIRKAVFLRGREGDVGRGEADNFREAEHGSLRSSTREANPARRPPSAPAPIQRPPARRGGSWQGRPSTAPPASRGLRSRESRQLRNASGIQVKPSLVP
jgi:hypothetical protein